MRDDSQQNEQAGKSRAVLKQQTFEMAWEARSKASQPRKDDELGRDNRYKLDCNQNALVEGVEETPEGH